MRLNEVPEQYKIYTIYMTSRSEYQIDGITKQNIMNAVGQWVELGNGTSLNKSYIIEIKLNKEETRTFVLQHQDEIKNSIVKL